MSEDKKQRYFTINNFCLNVGRQLRLDFKRNNFVIKLKISLSRLFTLSHLPADFILVVN